MCARQSSRRPDSPEESEADKIERAMEAASKDLLPCPFCGECAASIVQSSHKFRADDYVAECDNCGSFGAPRTTPTGAAALWNGRTPAMQRNLQPAA